MNESLGDNSNGQTEPGTVPSPSSHGLDELRGLIVGPEQRRLQELANRLDDPSLLAQDVSRVLPDALTLRSGDPQVTQALAPAVEEAMTASVRTNPHTLADALFPVMGPAIRKAIGHALRAMLEGLNRSLEYSFSFRSMGWRFEALKTGRPFAEIVLRHTILYRVEQVFLIHRQTGLLLQHVATEAAVIQDADMVSGMLSAIRDFVGDAFGAAREGESVDALRVGELVVLVEQSPDVLLAGLIRGAPPPELRVTFQETLEAIHLRFAAALRSFQGDAGPFAATVPYLEPCLRAQYLEKERRKVSRTWIAAGAVALLLIGWFVFWLRDGWRWRDYVESLRSEPGIVVISAERRWGKHYVAGLRDPLSRDPVDLLSGTGLDAQKVIGRWEPYQALLPKFIVTRAKILLQPPPESQLSYESGILYVRGPVSPDWMAEANRMSRAIPGVTILRRGETFDSLFERLKPEIESCRLQFATGDAEPFPGQDEVANKLIGQVHELGAAAQTTGKSLRVEVIGHANVYGSEARNLTLSQARADNLKTMLLSAGASGLEVLATGVGTRESRAASQDRRALAEDRCVTFRVSLASGPQAKRNRP